MNDTKTTTPEKPTVFKYEADDSSWVESLDTKIDQSKSYWEKEYKLEKVTKENEKLYLGPDPYSDDEEHRSSDNRIFTSVRTIIPYVTSRLTEPQVRPSSKSIASKRFAEDFEKAIFFHANDDEELKAKLKFALEDAVIRRRGYLKPRYDPQTGNFCSIEYVPAESIIVDHKSKPYEEPRYFRHVQDKSVQDLLTMFPDKESVIKNLFGIQENSKLSDYDKEVKLNEDWCFVVKDGELDLIVTWSYKKTCLGKMQDPNWRYGKSNFFKTHKMPLIFFNVLNDGRKRIDKTSFVEQAAAAQRNVNERNDQISTNAGLGNTGMPVVNSAVLADDQAQYLAFEEDTVLELDVPDGMRISDVFDVWKAGAMPNSVFENMLDTRNSIDNTFGTPNVFRGEQSKNNTLGQDELIRDQAFGRQQEIVDAIDAGMKRIYQFIAQFLLVYGDEEVFFSFSGEDGEFDYILIHTADLDPKAGIHVKAGSSMPIDRPQRRATADKAAQQGMIDPLSYWEIMDEANAQKYAKRFMDYKINPAKYFGDTDEDTFDRDAFVDINTIKQGGKPQFRDDLPEQYFAYLNSYVLSGDFTNPTIEPSVKDALKNFIQIQLERGKQQYAQLVTQEDKSPLNPIFDKPNVTISYKDVEDPASRAALLTNAGAPPADPSLLLPMSPAVIETAARGVARLEPGEQGQQVSNDGSVAQIDVGDIYKTTTDPTVKAEVEALAGLHPSATHIATQLVGNAAQAIPPPPQNSASPPKK